MQCSSLLTSIKLVEVSFIASLFNHPLLSTHRQGFSSWQWSRPNWVSMVSSLLFRFIMTRFWRLIFVSKSSLLWIASVSCLILVSKVASLPVSSEVKPENKTLRSIVESEWELKGWPKRQGFLHCIGGLVWWQQAYNGDAKVWDVGI